MRSAMTILAALGLLIGCGGGDDGDKNDATNASGGGEHAEGEGEHGHPHDDAADGDSHDDAQLVGGEYVGKWEIMGGDTILNLNINQDGTFRINGLEGGNDYTVDGAWAKERFVVILTTQNIKGMPFEAEWTANLHEGKLRVARGDLGPELVFDAN